MEINEDIELDIENKYMNKVVFTLEESIYILKQKFFCDEVEDMALDRLIKYIKEESIPRAVVEEKRKAILKEGKNMTEEERQKETMFLQGKLIALEELLNKGEK